MQMRSPMASVVVLLVAGSSALAQESPHRGRDFPLGEIVERVVARSDSAQAYALYLPSAYREDRAWPIIYAMDPRGRALVPMRLLRTVAERRGYIVLSSYNTLSDGPHEPNARALEALVHETERRFAADVRRIYLVGFSGTARVNWLFGYQLSGHVAGVIGFGAGIPEPAFLSRITPAMGTPFAYYGAVGTADFNFDEVRALDDALEAFGIRHRIEYFEGSHSWPPQDVLERAIEWMELGAMLDGLRKRDTALIDSLYRARAEDAARHLEAQDLYQAFERYQAMVEDFEGLRDVDAAAAEARRLGTAPEVQETSKELTAAVDRFSRYLAQLQRFLGEVDSAEDPPSLEQALERLDVEQLQRHAANTDNRLRAQAAQRLLENVFSRSSFYEPRMFLEQERPRHALAMLAIAEVVKPGHPRLCIQRARAFAQLGRSEEALAELECYVSNVPVPAATLRGDPSFAALQDDPRFQVLLQRVN